MIAAIRARSQNIDNPYLITIAVSLATFMEVLDTTITNVSLSHIAGSLGSSQDESTWVLTSYLVANAIVLPISGWLAGIFGRKRFFLMCIGAFTAASFLCGAATSLPMLIAFRLIQGLAGGGLQPIQQAIVMDTFPPEKRGLAFALTGITTIAAPVIGPTLGGYITDSYSWRWIFYMNVPVGIIAALMVAMLVRDPDHAKAKGIKSIDYTGLALLSLGLGLLQIMLDKGQQEDWFKSDFIVATGVLSFVMLSCALIWIWNQKDPIVELRLLTIRTFGLSCLSMFCVGAALYSSSALLPMITQSWFGYDAFLSGLVLSPGAILLLILMPISGKLVSVIQPKYLIAFGFTMGAIGMWGTSHVTPQVDYWTFVMFRVMQVVGLPFLFVPVSTMAFSEIPKEISNKASSIFSLSRNIGGSIGISVIASYVARQSQVHQTEAVSHLQESSAITQSYIAQTTQTLIDHGHSLVSAPHQANSIIYQEVIKQSSILAYGDAFLIVSYVMFALAIVTLLYMPKRRKASASAPPEGMH